MSQYRTCRGCRRALKSPGCPWCDEVERAIKAAQEDTRPTCRCEACGLPIVSGRWCRACYTDRKSAGLPLGREVMG